MKGIILAGGLGSRLYPITLATCKQLLPVYDKPMIYYPLSTLMQSNIRDILIISTEGDLDRFQALFGDGKHLGLSIQYAVQQHPRGIAEAFLIAKHFIGSDHVCLILGDNIFYGSTIEKTLTSCRENLNGGLIFGYQVKDPHRYGVVALNDRGEMKDIVEKPLNPPSSLAVTGLYFYDNEVIEIAKQLKPSPRGELEITDVNRAYLSLKKLQVFIFEKGFAWLDTGTPQALSQASDYVQVIQERQGIKIACIEEIAFRNNFIDIEQLQRLANLYKKTEYGAYLMEIIERESRPEKISVSI